MNERAGTSEASQARPSRGALPPTVWLLGFASLLNDASSEAVFPLLGVFLTTLGAPLPFVGLALGLADGLAVVVKVLVGRWSDRLRRRPLVIGGYLVAALGRGLIALAMHPWHVAFARSLDRMGKAIRSGARDAVLVDAVASTERGRAFGFTQALDHVGAAVGPLIASVCLAVGWSMRQTFGLAAAIGVLAPLLLGWRLSEAPRAPTVKATPTDRAPPEAPGSRTPLRVYLMAVGVFAVANSSDAFILIRAGQLGWTPAMLPLLWLGHHLVKALTTAVGGGLSDRMPRFILIGCGWLAYAGTYVGFSLATKAWHIAALMGAYAFYHGFAEGPERALVSDLAGPRGRGAAFGLYHGVVGGAALPAGLLMGAVWQRWGVAAAFRMEGALAVLAAIGLGALAWRGRLRPVGAGR